MNTTLGAAAAQALTALAVLPLEQRVAAWKSMTLDVFEAASARWLDWGEGEMSHPPTTVDDELSQLDLQRRALETCASTASAVARSADASLHAFADAHTEVVRRIDSLELDQSWDEPTYFVACEFAADDLASMLGVQAGTAEAWATTGETLRRELPKMWTLCGAGKARVASCAAIARELDHLDHEQRAHVEGLAISARAPFGSAASARRRVRKLLVKLGLNRGY